MKKFNLIVFSVLVSVLLVSMLSAGITGQVVSFKKGEIKTTDSGIVVSDLEISRGQAIFKIENPTTGEIETITGQEGAIITTASGMQVQIIESKSPFFSKDKLKIAIEPVKNQIDNSIIGGGCGCFNPLNVFDMINARCKWHIVDALSIGGVVPNEYCDNLEGQYICVDVLGVDYVSAQGSVEGVVPADCNINNLHQALFIRCCDARAFT